jgi:hypothetical protein
VVSEDVADRLAAVAMELAQRVRDDDPEANRRWLHAVLPDPTDREALLYVLAAAVPDDRPWSHLVEWVRQPVSVRSLRLQPCGTRAAYRRHLAKGDPPCLPCDEENRRYERERKQRLRSPT